MTQLPSYRPQDRNAQAPSGFQPPKPQTQQNNGGPTGFGQPRKDLKTAINPSAAPTPAGSGGPPPPPQGMGNPQALYPQPTDPLKNAESDLWASRHSRPPDQLIRQAFAAFRGREPQPHETEQLMQHVPNIDALMQILFSLKQEPQPQAPQPQLPPMASAVLGI